MTDPRFVVPVRDLVRALESEPRFRDRIEALRWLPPTPPRYGDWPDGLSPDVRAAAAAAGIDRLYTHQAQAVARVQRGENVVVATGTASGKSLCYLLPVIDAAHRSPDARALMLFPTKALAHDQLAALAPWERALPGHALRAAAYDGDTPRGSRPAVRRSARIVATNPDMLHGGILPHHARWASLLRGLTHVVVDEMHVYRGVFGSHVANVLRRLRRVARFYGADPRFVLTSATIANPGELGAQLSGGPVSVVDDDGSPRGGRHFVLYNPPVVDERLNVRRSATLETDVLARHFLEGGVQTIVFARSRQGTELIARYINEGLGAASRGGQDHADASPTVRGYRGGYRPTERRAIERALREGTLRGVVATNALELGVDIGRLDACVMAGYPGTIASTWQQSGRAGRRSSESVSVLVASASPLDQFIAHHPEYLFGRSPEHARVDPDNLIILLDHVRCAAFELPFGPGEAAWPFGTPDTDDAPDELGDGAGRAPAVGALLAVLEGQGVVQRVGDTWYWLADAYPAEGISLRSSGPDAVTIVARTGGDETEAYDVLGTVERATAPLTVHPGAVYLHDGRVFSVETLDWDQGRALVVEADSGLYTRASARVDLRPTRVAAERVVGRAQVSHGELDVRSRVTGYRKVRFRTHETVGWGDVDLPEQRYVAGGYWFTLDEDAVAHLKAVGRWRFDPSGNRGPNWSVQRERARTRDGNRCRLCDAPARPGRAHDVHHIRPFHTFGWVDGANEAYREANALENLITVCRGCHNRAERALGLHGALSGIGYALRHIAPLHLMCDSRDIDVASESHAPWTGRPTVTVYERAVAGVGFGAALFELHERVLGACAEMIRDCPCEAGCPSCVGPSGALDADAKAHAMAVLEALGG